MGFDKRKAVGEERRVKQVFNAGRVEAAVFGIRMIAVNGQRDCGKHRKG